MDKSKVCKVCKEIKNLLEFHKNKNKDGRFNVCKKCHHIRTKKWRLENRHKIPKYCRTSSLRHRYEITDNEYDQMVKKQNNRCLICGKIPEKNKAFQTWHLHVDHCHKTKKVRGLLCHLCNRGLGLFRENADLLEKAAIYLKSFRS